MSDKQRELLARFQSAEVAAKRIEQRRHKNRTHFDRLRDSLAENDITVPYGYGEVLGKNNA